MSDKPSSHKTTGIRKQMHENWSLSAECISALCHALAQERAKLKHPDMIIK